MRSNWFRTALLTVAIAAGITLPTSTAVALGTTNVRAKGLSLDDRAYYLDIGATLPPSFRVPSPDELDEPPDPSGVVFTSDDPSATLFAYLEVGKGRSASTIAREFLDHTTDPITIDDVTAYLAEQGESTEGVAVSSPEWSDVMVGDGAKTGLSTISVDGQPVAHFEALLMVVARGGDTALVEVDQAFEIVPVVDITQVAATIADRIRTGPPSPDLPVAQAGLIGLTDMPARWSEVPGTATGSPSDGLGTGSGALDPRAFDTGALSTGTSSTGTFDARSVGALANQVPACKPLVTIGAVATGADDTSRSPAVISEPFALGGSQFTSGSSVVASQVSVYPSAADADRLFGFVGTKSASACLEELYRRAARTSHSLGAKHTPTVKVTEPRTSAVGDERHVFRISVDVDGHPGTHVVVEQEFVHVGRTVATYTFAGKGGMHDREQVIGPVSARLAAVPNVR